MQRDESRLARLVLEAIWAHDTDALYELAPCGCCCHEHYFDNCVARLYGGCRGAVPMTMAELRDLANKAD